MSFYINFYGDGVRILNCSIPVDTFSKFREYTSKYSLDWKNELLDLEVLAQLGYSHWNDFVINETTGLLISSRNKIEVKKKAKKILKIQADKIMNTGLLFNLYQTHISEIPQVNPSANESPYFNIIIKEIGLIAKYKIDVNEFNIDDLKFRVKTSKNEIRLIDEVSYKNAKLECIKTDCLVRSMSIE